MSNQPEIPRPYEGQAPQYAPPGYYAPASPPPSEDMQPPAPSQPVYSPVPLYSQGVPEYSIPVTGPRGLSLSSMIIGLVSLVAGAGFIIAPQIVGIVLGHLGLRKENPQGRAFAITGLITNYLALVIWVALYAFLILVIAVAEGESGY